MQFNKEEQLANIDKDIEELRQKRRLVSEALVGFQTLTEKESELTIQIRFLNNLKSIISNDIQIEKERAEWKASVNAV